MKLRVAQVDFYLTGTHWRMISIQRRAFACPLGVEEKADVGRPEGRKRKLVVMSCEMNAHCVWRDKGNSSCMIVELIDSERADKVATLSPIASGSRPPMVALKSPHSGKTAPSSCRSRLEARFGKSRGHYTTTIMGDFCSQCLLSEEQWDCEH